MSISQRADRNANELSRVFIVKRRERNENVLDANNFQALRNDHALLSVVGGGNSLEDLQASESELTTSGLVGNHSSYDAEEHLGRSTLVERSFLRVGAQALVQETHPLDLVSVDCGVRKRKSEKRVREEQK